jgi:hypothetical protein
MQCSGICQDRLVEATEIWIRRVADSTEAIYTLYRSYPMVCESSLLRDKAAVV